jgi:hypothetical protein
MQNNNVTSLIANEEEILAFFDALGFPATSSFYFHIAARKKYGAKVDALLTRTVVTRDTIVDVIHRSTPARGFYAYGEKVPHSALVCYMTPEPRNVEQATRRTCAKFLLKEDSNNNKEFDMRSEYLTEIQKAPLYNGTIIDIDLDIPEIALDVLKGLRALGIKPIVNVQTRGGFHFVCQMDKPKKSAVWMRFKSIDPKAFQLVKNGLIPIPGTIQGGVPVKLFTSIF